MNLVLKRMEGSALFTINIDGSDLRQIFWRPEYRRCSTPVWSPDGSKIAFSVLRFGVGIQPERIAVMDASGENLKELGAGISPSWSPDGKRIAFSAIGPDNQGVCIMNADGTNVKSVDPQGWSASWSPKGDVLAYIKHEDANPKLCIYDLNTWKHSALLNKPYQQINCLPAWSPDAQWICFKGILPEGNEELAVVHAEGQEKGFRILFPGPAMADAQRIDRAFGWQAKPENRILASVAAPDSHRTFVLRLIDPEGKTPMQRIAGQDAIRSRKDANFSPDGKKIIFSGPSKGFSMLQ
jgi:Tol biopolymer transport system component